MGFEHLKNEQTFIAFTQETQDNRILNLGEAIAVGGYGGVLHRAKEYKKKNPNLWVRIAMIVEEIA